MLILWIQWLQTDMGGSRADLPPATGAQGVLDIVQKTTPSQNGKALNIHVPGWEENEGLNQYKFRYVAPATIGPAISLNSSLARRSSFFRVPPSALCVKRL